MYAVPARRITDRPLRFWRWYHDVIARPENQREHGWGSGYAFELIWKYLLGPADLYPVRLPDPSEARAVAEVENSPHGGAGCNCSAGGRECSDPMQVPVVSHRDCRDCPFRPAVDWFPRGQRS